MLIELTNEERAILRIALGCLLDVTYNTPATRDVIKALRERLTRDGE
jgi:hypothetical protein